MSRCSSESDSDQREQAPSFTNDADAEAARDTGIAAFNEGRLVEAHRIQVGLLGFFTAKFGENAPCCAIYYLDYGVTLLAMIQSSDNEKAALAGNTGDTNEDIEICSNVLELARVCFDKQEELCDPESLEYITIQKRLAEVHEALAQLHHERDAEPEALIELETCLVLRRAVFAKNHRAIIGTLFQIGNLYLRNEEFQKAEDVLVEATSLAETNPDVPTELREELAQFLEEARDMKNQGGLEAVKREIRGLFPEEAETTEEPSVAPTLLAAVPEGLAGFGRAAHNSLVQQAPAREQTQSLSFFPKQFMGDAERSMTIGDKTAAAAMPVNTAVQVRRKERARPETPAPTAKLSRSEQL